MAINNATSGLISVGASTYASVQGTLQLEYNAIGDNPPEIVNINMSKLAKGTTFSIRSAGSGYAGHRFLGSSYGVTTTPATTGDSILTDEALPNTVRITGGYGNINILTRAAIGDTQPAEYTVVSLKSVIGRRLAAGSIIPQGSYAFVTTTTPGTASVTFSKFSQPTLGIINAGHGVGVLSNGDFEASVRLNEVDYPFTTTTGDSLELVGSAVAFR